MACLVAAGVLVVSPCRAQDLTPWSVAYTAERADATVAGLTQRWRTDRATLGWAVPDVGGWQGVVERHQRLGREEWTAATRGYVRRRDWTYSAGVGGSERPTFLYRVLGEAGVSRRVAGTVVATLDYRYLSYSATTIQQWQPAVTWYHRRGEVGGRVFRTRDSTRGRTNDSVLVHAIHDLSSRVRLSGGVAAGTRIYDVVSLPDASARSRVAFVNVRLGVTRHDFVDAGVTTATEAPDFNYRSFTVGYRRAF